MISGSLAVEGHAHGLGLPGHHPYMTYPEPWRAATHQVAKHPEFLRPAPKQPNINNRYNGVQSTVSALNGSRMATTTSPRSNKYSPPAAAGGPVNLAQHKEELPSATEDSGLPVAAYTSGAYPRLYPHSPFSSVHYQSSLPGPYASMYPSPYSSLIRPGGYVQPPPLSPLDTYSPPAATATPLPTRPAPLTLKDKPKTSVLPAVAGFKVPSGKEGSLKHRILTRPSEGGGVACKKRVSSTLSPPATPTKPTLNTNNNTVPGNFAKGSLIQLANGELRRVEDMRTEDFVLSAEKNPELRLAESTVVRIEENPIVGAATITLSYNQNRTQVEFESTLEHPFYVYGQGWASCHPDRTLQCYGLKVHRLQVGDILVSLTPRESAPVNTRTSTITTTATTTAMTARQVSRQVSTNSLAGGSEHKYTVDKTLLPPPPPVLKEEPMDVSNSRKRRWSAPDQICDEDEQASSKRKE